MLRAESTASEEAPKDKEKLAMNRGLKIIPHGEEDESNILERPKVEAKARQNKPGYGRDW